MTSALPLRKTQGERVGVGVLALEEPPEHLLSLLAEGGVVVEILLLRRIVSQAEELPAIS